MYAIRSYYVSVTFEGFCPNGGECMSETDKKFMRAAISLAEKGMKIQMQFNLPEKVYSLFV